MASGTESRTPEVHPSLLASGLRAAVLGSDDAIVSTASLMIGVAAASSDRQAILVAGVAGLVAGAMSMAVGEFVSVSSQADAELADTERERAELKANPEGELRELAAIYAQRGLDPALARQVAEQLSRGDRLGAHLRDELGITEHNRARPLQAAAISALSFSLFALVPIAALLLSPAPLRIPAMAVFSVLSLAGLGALGGRLGGAPILPAAIRVAVGGSVAMAVTFGIGRWLGVSVG